MLCNFPSMACTLWSGLSLQPLRGRVLEPRHRRLHGRDSPELYIRWAQWGLLSSHSRAHGTTSREPWSQGEQALTIFREFDELRYQLIPYLYSWHSRRPRRVCRCCAPWCCSTEKTRMRGPPIPNTCSGPICWCAQSPPPAWTTCASTCCRSLVRLLEWRGVRGWPVDHGARDAGAITAVRPWRRRAAARSRGRLGRPACERAAYTAGLPRRRWACPECAAPRGRHFDVHLSRRPIGDQRRRTTTAVALSAPPRVTASRTSVSAAACAVSDWLRMDATSPASR